MTKNKSKIIFVFSLVFLFFLFVNFSSAQGVDSQDVVIKQLTEYDLKRPCFNNGTYCSSSANCNITVLNPSGSPIFDNSAMTYNVSYFNITFLKSKTVNVGLHQAIMSCTDGAVSGEDTFNILISPSGTNDDSTAQWILLLFGFLISFGIIFWGYNINDGWIVILGSLILFVLGIYTLLNGVANYRNTLTLWGSVIILGLAGYISVRSGLELING